MSPGLRTHRSLIGFTTLEYIGFLNGNSSLRDIHPENRSPFHIPKVFDSQPRIFVINTSIRSPNLLFVLLSRWVDQSITYEQNIEQDIFVQGTIETSTNSLESLRKDHLDIGDDLLHREDVLFRS